MNNKRLYESKTHQIKIKLSVNDDVHCNCIEYITYGNLHCSQSGPQTIYGKKHHTKDTNPSNQIVSDNSNTINNIPLTQIQEKNTTLFNERLLMHQPNMKKKNSNYLKRL